MVMFNLWMIEFDVGTKYLPAGGTVTLLELSEKAKTVLKSAKKSFLQAEYLPNWGKLGPDLFMYYRYHVYLHFISKAYPGGKVGQSRYSALKFAF